MKRNTAAPPAASGTPEFSSWHCQFGEPSGLVLEDLGFKSHRPGGGPGSPPRGRGPQPLGLLAGLQPPGPAQPGAPRTGYARRRPGALRPPRWAGAREAARAVAGQPRGARLPGEARARRPAAGWRAWRRLTRVRYAAERRPGTLRERGGGRHAPRSLPDPRARVGAHPG